MNKRDAKAPREIVRLCELGSTFVERGHDWYTEDPLNVPGLAAESLIVKIGENVARLSSGTLEKHPDVPWSLIKRMRDRLAHRYEATDYEAVWDTLKYDLPKVRSYLISIDEVS